MRYLLDAHCLIWALDEPSKLGLPASHALEDAANELLLSAGTIWELSIKVGLGKLSLSLPFRDWVGKAIAELGIVLLPITLDHADQLAALPQHHRDPFDRLLAAQCLVEQASLLSADEAFDAYGVNRIWN